MAMVVGVGLAVLTFVGMPLQYAAHHPSVVQIVGPVHGIFYILYLVVSLDLAGRARFNLVQLLGMVCAGWVPLLAFYMERKVTQRVKGLIALGPDAPPGPAATLANLVTARTGRPGGGAGPLPEPRE
jgi:integral membrane protein